MGSSSSDSYDVIDYPSGPLPQAHPNRLATIAKLFGMDPAPVDQCRLLELGCGDGGHLIPCAIMLPHSDFVGMDRAAGPVARAKGTADLLAARNVRFECTDIMDVSLSGEQFDYILMHGLYSWVPAEVRERCFALCQSRLASQGVVYVGYNCYPGSYVRRMFWEMLKYHVRDLSSPMEQIQQAQALAAILGQASAGSSAAYRKCAQEELSELSERRHPGLLFHDDLSEINEPVYFHEFVAQAERHGFQFLGEVDVSAMQLSGLRADVRAMLAQLEQHDVVLKEQYRDFFTGRRFRRTLLCRQEIALDRQIEPAQAKDFRIQSAVRANGPAADLAPGVRVEFRGPQVPSLEVDHPLTKAALHILADRWPRSVPYRTLVKEARERLRADPGFHKRWLHADPTADEQALNDILLRALGAGSVRWLAYQQDWDAAVGECPQLCPLNRLELEQGSTVLTTRDLTVLPIPHAFERLVLSLADGNTSRETLITKAEAQVQADPSLAPPTNPANEATGISVAANSVLLTAARFGLLVDD